MNDKIRYRGPDGEGIFCDKVSLGHRRLKIIDLSDNAKQPMSNENGDLWIVFNGEIYNFQELRKELEPKHKFKSKSDTEVILHAYEEWAFDCVNRFNGMWAFCIYDKKKQIFFLSRDRLGKKPLHYYFKDKKFIFSSEIKAILQHPIKRELNKAAVSSFLSYRYVLGEETFFRDIKKLMPAHNLVFDLKKNRIERVWEYWDLPQAEIRASEDEAKKGVDELLAKSVRYRKISDVPLGVILSGGLDSSLITALLAIEEKKENKQVNTFTVKFREEGFDETKFAKIVANNYNTKYFEVVLDTSNFLEVMKEYTKYKDEPIGVPNEIALYLLAKKIKENVTVVLSGEGADELFEGYGRIFTSARDYRIINRLKKMPDGLKVYKTKFSNLYKKYGTFFESELEHFLFMYKWWTDKEKDFILLPEAKQDLSVFFQDYLNKFNADYEKKISYLFLKLHLPGLLNRLDNPTMANAVEGRAPFLDYLLVEMVFNLPCEYKTKWKINEKVKNSLNKNCDELSEKKNTSKHILKKVAEKYLPLAIANREKQGFPLPLDKWFKEELSKVSKDMLLSEDAKIKHVINQKKLAEWIDSDYRDIRKFGQKLWMILSLELWLREWFPEI